MDSIKSFLIRFFFKFFIRFFVYAIAITPFCLSITMPLLFKYKFFYVLFSILLSPILIILISGLMYSITPKVNFGSYKLFSNSFIKWFLKDTLADIVLSSSLLNNLANRVDFIKSIYYRLIGVSNPDTLIMASDVIILDPERYSFGNNIFIGYDTMISGHFVKNRKLILIQGEIKNNVQIGACCKLAPGITLGNNVIVGFGVTIGINCIIGDNVVIHDTCIIDDNVIIGNNSIIGKNSLIGRKSYLGNNIYIGNYSSIGSKVKIKSNSRISELSIIKNSNI